MITLGSKVRDRTSGFEGIAMSRHIYMTGCARIGVQPKVDKDGKLPDSQSFDEPMLEVLAPPVSERDPRAGTGVG